jgi:3-phytase
MLGGGKVRRGLSIGRPVGTMVVLLASVASVVAVTSIVKTDDPPPWSGPTVPAVAQTDAAYGEKDAADDPAIWVHPTDASLSLVIGTNKRDPGGLQVFDMDGRERQFLEAGQLNNVDLREGFPFADGPGALVAATNRSDDTVALFRVDPSKRMLEKIASLPTDLRDVYGLCLHQAADTNRVYAFVTSVNGPVHQYELNSGRQGISMTQVRSWTLDSVGEGCVVDDDYGQLYLTEEERGLWKLPADPDISPAAIQLVDEITPDGTRLVADIEGVAIYDQGGREGYLVVSNQGNSTFAVYERSGSNDYLNSFAVRADDGVDGANVTDGLEVTAVPIDERFPEGLLVVHDQRNRNSDTSNFKYVSWADVSQALNLSGIAH